MAFWISAAASLGTLFIFVIVKLSTVNRKLDRLSDKMDLHVIERLTRAEQRLDELAKRTHSTNTDLHQTTTGLELLEQRVDQHLGAEQSQRRASQPLPRKP